MPDTLPAILLVEDDAIVRMLMVDVLEDAGHQVLEADSWDAALSVLADPAQPLTMMVTDVGLRDAHERDGLALARHAQQLRGALPVLIASGFAGLDIPAGSELITKPFSIDQLRDKVQAMLH